MAINPHSPHSSGSGVEFPEPGLPALAYRYPFPTGVLNVSWDAVSAYGLEPRRRVERQPHSNHVGVNRLEGSGQPGLNVSVVTLAEAMGAVLWLREESGVGDYIEEPNMTSIWRPHRLDVVVRPPLTLADEPEDQQAILAGYYGAEWLPDGVAELQKPDGVRRFLRHLTHDLIVRATDMTYRSYLEHPHNRQTGYSHRDEIHARYVEAARVGTRDVLRAPAAGDYAVQ